MRRPAEQSPPLCMHVHYSSSQASQARVTLESVPQILGSSEQPRKALLVSGCDQAVGPVHSLGCPSCHAWVALVCVAFKTLSKAGACGISSRAPALPWAPNVHANPKAKSKKLCVIASLQIDQINKERSYAPVLWFFIRCMHCGLSKLILVIVVVCLAVLTEKESCWSSSQDSTQYADIFVQGSLGPVAGMSLPVKATLPHNFVLVMVPTKVVPWLWKAGL